MVELGLVGRRLRTAMIICRCIRPMDRKSIRGVVVAIFDLALALDRTEIYLEERRLPLQLTLGSLIASARTAMDLVKADNDVVHAHQDLYHRVLLPVDIEVRTACLHLHIWDEAVAGAGEVAVAIVMSIAQAEAAASRGVFQTLPHIYFRLFVSCMTRHCLA